MIAALASAALAAGAALQSSARPLSPGIQVVPARELGGDPAWAGRVVIVDPSQARFAIRFDPARPTLGEWRKREPRAVAILNGSFYSSEPGGIRPTCDTLAAGHLFRGAGCHRQDALFFGARARDGDSRSRPAALPRLLDAGAFRAEDWLDALKSFPALVRQGAPACSSGRYCNESSRTAAVAQLRDGRLVLFATQWPAIRRDVGRWMAEQLGALDALNLDGGPEAALAVAGEPLEEAVGTPGVGLPLVLLLLPRE